MAPHVGVIRPGAQDGGAHPPVAPAPDDYQFVSRGFTGVFIRPGYESIMRSPSWFDNGQHLKKWFEELAAPYWAYQHGARRDLPYGPGSGPFSFLRRQNAPTNMTYKGVTRVIYFDPTRTKFVIRELLGSRTTVRRVMSDDGFDDIDTYDWVSISLPVSNTLSRASYNLRGDMYTVLTTGLQYRLLHSTYHPVSSFEPAPVNLDEPLQWMDEESPVTDALVSCYFPVAKGPVNASDEPVRYHMWFDDIQSSIPVILTTTPEVPVDVLNAWGVSGECIESHTTNDIPGTRICTHIMGYTAAGRRAVTKDSVVDIRTIAKEDMIDAVLSGEIGPHRSMGEMATSRGGTSAAFNVIIDTLRSTKPRDLFRIATHETTGEIVCDMYIPTMKVIDTPSWRSVAPIGEAIGQVSIFASLMHEYNTLWFGYRVINPGRSHSQWHIAEGITKMVGDRDDHESIAADVVRSETCLNALRAVNESQNLYEYQKENVRSMVQREHTSSCVREYIGHTVFKHDDHVIVKTHATDETAYIVRNCDKTWGGVLADEVGMGTTRQIIELVRCTTTADTAATVVVVPPSILGQWVAEVRTVWPDCKVAVFHGASKKKLIRTHTRESIVTDHNIIITTPGLFGNLSGEMESSGDADDRTPQRYERVVVDEAHMSIGKVHGNYTAVKRWAVTATPYSMHSGQFCQLLMWLANAHSSNTKSISTDTGNQYVVARGLFIRKTQEMHALLPPVEHIVTEVPMATGDVEATHNVLRHGRVSMHYVDAIVFFNRLVNAVSFGHRYTPTLPPPPVTATGQQYSTEVLESVPDPPPACPICLSDVDVTAAAETGCSHWFCVECLDLYISNKRGCVTCPMCRAEIYASSVRRTVPEQPDEAKDDAEMEVENATPPDQYMSAKMTQVVADFVGWLEEGKKIVLFVDQAQTLWLASAALKLKGISHQTLTGSMSVTRRMRVFDRFQHATTPESHVLIATTKCASAGINLTKADVICMLSPAIDKGTVDQVIGRARRIGRPHDQPIKFVQYCACRHDGHFSVDEMVLHQVLTHSGANQYNIVHAIIAGSN